MINLCNECGTYTVKKEISECDSYTICPNCGNKRKFLKMPLFIVTGASGVGKTSACNYLQQITQDVVVMESDILWDDSYNTPEDNYRKFRELWLRICKNISQCGKPVVLCGCAIPEQFEICDERIYFSDIYYLAIVCDNEDLEKRMRYGRNIMDENWIKSSIDFNSWLKTNSNKTSPNITLLDSTNKTQQEITEEIKQWLLYK